MNMEDSLSEKLNRLDKAKILLKHAIHNALKSCKIAQEEITRAKTANEIWGDKIEEEYQLKKMEGK